MSILVPLKLLNSEKSRSFERVTRRIAALTFTMLHVLVASSLLSREIVFFGDEEVIYLSSKY